MAIPVNVDNFVQAETARMFADLQRDAGDVNCFAHNRAPASVEHQPVIRLNRDTLYSFAVVDISAGATLTVPEHGERYVSVMVVDQDHHIARIEHDAGEHRLHVDDVGTPYVGVAVRILVDPTDAQDVAAVVELQDRLELTAGSSVPLQMPDYDSATFDAARKALLTLAVGLDAFDRMFGARGEVDPVRHLIGTAAGWGGLPTEEASYIGVNPGLPPEAYELTVRDVPVDAFWSISVYDANGFFVPNARGVYSVNSVTGVRNTDGSITVRFGDHGPDAPNAIPTPVGWNYLVRLYRPRREILDGTWTFPSIERRLSKAR